MNTLNKENEEALKRKTGQKQEGCIPSHGITSGLKTLASGANFNSLDNFKFFIYEIDYKFSVEKLINERNKQMGLSNCDWNQNICKEINWEKEYSTMRQYGADITIIELYKNHDNRVLDPNKADFFIIPYPHSSILRNPDHAIWREFTEQHFSEFDELIYNLKYYNSETKDRHLWILTGDEKNHLKLLEEHPLRTTLGPNNYYKNIKPIIIPPSILEPRFQPSQLIQEDWTRERKISVVMIAGLINNVRCIIFNTLSNHKEIEGLPVETHIIEGHRKFPFTPQEVWQKYHDSIFSVILTGDLPYQKRFFDVCLSGCIPIVISYNSTDPNKKSWFNHNGPPFDNCYPWADIINYKEFVLEIDSVDNLIPEIKKLMNNKNKLNKMRNALKDASIKFVIGLGKDKYKYKDAFYYLNMSIKEYLENININSTSDTTGKTAHFNVRKLLKETGEVIDENAKDYYCAEKAVNKLENDLCKKWNTEKGIANDYSHIEKLNFNNTNLITTMQPDEVDIVIPTIRDLKFLKYWEKYLKNYHFILIQDGNPEIELKIDDWVDYELYNRNDIKRILGDKHWIISERDASIRNFGFLVSNKKYIWTLDDDCYPIKDDKDNNVLFFHLKNLKTPSTPYFWNTLYDPYEKGCDFVRGYPYSLRNGVKTVISHGLWINVPDYDAITQLLKPQEKNDRIIKTTMTIPNKTLYPMCSMNVAFDRENIGPAFMQGLMGKGQPWARYDDMFCGWASKVISDHLNFGVKSGFPYIKHMKASNPFTNLKKEFMGFWWQEDLIKFFNNVKFQEEDDNASKCYLKLAEMIRDKFKDKHGYFERLANAMEIWIEIWNDNSIIYIPSRINKKISA